MCRVRSSGECFRSHSSKAGGGRDRRATNGKEKREKRTTKIRGKWDLLYAKNRGRNRGYARATLCISAPAGLSAPTKSRVSAREVSSMATGVELKQEPRETIEGPKSEAELDGLQNGARASSNALICIEPWRCRLPMVQTESPSGRFAPPG